MKDINSKEIIKAIAFVAAMIGSFYAFNVYVEGLVDKRIENKRTLKKLSRMIRPAVLFDNKGAILADQGGLEYIESINLAYYDKKDSGLPIKVEVKTKRFLAQAPLLTSIDNYSFYETAERGKGLSWVFNLEPLNYPDPVGTLRFRLEILY